MKTILFLSFFILFVGVTFSTQSETAETPETGETGETIDTAFEPDVDSETVVSDFENAMDVNENMPSNQEKKVKKETINIKLTPGKDIVLTISPDSYGSGVTYIRWGKLSCPTGAQLIYQGYAGGGWYAQKGNGANYLCLPKDPQYLSTTAPVSPSQLYGAEYETGNKIFGKTTQNYNVPCVVCHRAKRSSKLVIPAKISCPKSWNREYYGYLMTNYHGYVNMQYECVDYNPDVIGSSKNTNGALFYFMEVICGYGLPCGPYVAKRAITCAVCTK